MRRLRPYTLLLALGLAGCLGPRPPLPMGAQVTPPQAWRFDPGATVPLETSWWRAFGDPALTAVIDQALANNPDIGQAVERVEQARAVERQARANRGPEIDGQNVGGYTRELGPPIITTPFAIPEATVAWDLDVFHRLREANAAARASLLATEATRDAVQLSIASTAASSYITLLGLDARLAIVRQNISLRADFLHTAERRAAVGYTSQLELKQAQAEYQATAALEPAAALAVSQEEDALSALLGQSPRTVIRAAAGLEALTVPAVPGGLPSSLLRRRPDVFAAQETVIAADHSLSSARAAMLPDFALTGDIGEEFAQVLTHGEVEYLIASSVVGPLFDSGRRRAAADAVAAQRNQAAYAYKGVVLRALRDVDDSLVAIQRDREQNGVLATQVEVEDATLHVASQRYRAGYTPYFDQIDSERQLLTAQLSLAQARTAWLTAYVTLYEALGGGWRWQDAQAATYRR